MGKKRSPVFKIEDTMKSLGIPDLRSSQVVQDVEKQRKARLEANSYQPDQLNPTYRDLKYDKEIYGDLLEPGQWSLPTQQMDDAVSDNQGTLNRLSKFFTRIPPVLTSKFLAQTASLAHAIDNKVIGRSDENAMTDEKLAEVMAGYQDIENVVKSEWLPVFENSRYKDTPLLEQLATTQFWADTMADGVAFVGAIAVGSKGLAGAAGNVGKAFSFVPASQKVVKFGNMSTSFGVAGANAAMTASMQGEQAYTQLYDQLQRTIDPETGMLYEKEKAQQKASEAAAKTFNGTFWVHTIPALWETRTILSLGKTLDNAVGTEARKRIIDQLSSGKMTIQQLYANPSKYLNKGVLSSAGKRAGVGLMIEGPYEENIENAVVSTAIDQTINNTDGDLMSTIGSYINNMIDNFQDKEALTEMVVGSIIGGGMGAVSGAGEARAFNQASRNFVNGMQAADNLYLANVNAPFKRHEKDVTDENGVTYKQGDLLFDKSGNPIVDPAALTRLAKQTVADQNLADSAMNAFLTNNPETLWMNENLSLSSAVFSEMARAEAFGDTPEGAMDLLALRLEKRLEEIETERVAGKVASESTSEEAAPTPAAAEAAALLSQRKNNIRNRIKDLGRAYQNSKTKIDKKIGVNSSPEYKNFLDVAHKTLFYEETKRATYDQIVADLNEQLTDPLADQQALAAKIKAISDNREASFEVSRKLLNNTVEAYNDWTASENFIEENNQTKIRLDGKENKTAEETAELNKANFNIGRSIYSKGSFADYSDPRITIEPIQRAGQSTGRTAEVYQNIGKEKVNKESFDSFLDNNQYDEALNSLSKMSEKDNEIISKVDSKITEKDNQIEEADQAITDIMNTDDSIDEFNPATFTPELEEAFQTLEKLKADREKLVQIKTMADEKNSAPYSKMTPQEVADEVEFEYAESLSEKANHIEAIAIDDSGNVREDFVEVSSVDRAIRDLETLIDGISGIKTDEPLSTRYNNLKDSAERLLSLMKGVRESAILNQNNLLGKQKAIANNRAEILIDTILSPSIAAVFNEVLGGTLNNRITQIRNLKENKLEAVMALITYVKDKGKSTQLTKALKDIQKTSRNNFASMLKDQAKNTTPITKQFKKNPASSLMAAWLKLNYTFQSDVGLIDISKGSPYSKFEANKDYTELLDLLKTSPVNVTGLPSGLLEPFVEEARRADGAIRMQLLLNGKTEAPSQMVAYSKDSEFVPTPQQEISAREIASWLNSKKSNVPYGNWGYLRGVAGTGKTNIVLRWALELAGIPVEDMVGTARVESAAKVLQESIGTKTVVFNDLDLNTISDNTNLIIIDEYATIDTQRLRAFENDVRLLNQTRDHKISVLLLGDPTQITPNGSVEFDLIEVRADNSPSHQTENIQHFTPLTVVYRSDVSGVNEVSSYFQGNNKDVPTLSVRASSPIDSPLAIGAHVTPVAGSIEETIKRNQDEENSSGIKPRSRAIIIGKPEQAKKYEHIPGVDVLWVVDAQSRTYDEVYVDIEANDYPSAPNRNTAMYTAISRAKQYVQVVHKGNNNVDSSLLTEQNVNLGNIQQAKEEFTKRKNAEIKFLEDLKNGKSLKTPTTEKEPEAKVKVAPAPKVISKYPEPLVETDEESDIETTEEKEIETVIEGDQIVTEVETKNETENEYSTGADGDPNVPVIETSTTLSSSEVSISEPNIDTEAYNAAINGLIEGNENVVYFLNEDGNIESYVFSPKANRWIKLGFYNTDNPSSIHPSLRDSVQGKNRLPKGFIKEINRKGNVWSPEDLQNHPSVIAAGTLNGFTPMKFNYSPTPNEGKGDNNIVDWLKDKFKNFFGLSPEQKSRENKISFKIFSATELSRQGYINSNYAKNLKPGLPYMVIGGNQNEGGYEHAFFVPLQPKALSEDSSQVQVLRNFRDLASRFQDLTSIKLGTESFNNLIASLKAGLEVRMVETESGNVPQVFVKENFSYEDFVSDIERRQGKTEIKNPLEKLAEQDREAAISLGLQIASQLYGYKMSPMVYTEEDFNKLNEGVEAGGEYVKVEASREFDVDGKPVYKYYAYRQADALGKSPKSVYKKVPSLDPSKGPAQIALNQLARANEYVGGTRIRVPQYTSNKAARRLSGTGKSLMSGSGGGARIQGMLNLLKTHLADFGMLDENFTEEQVLKNFKRLVKEAAGTEANDYAVYRDSIAQMISEVEDPALKEELEAKFSEIEQRKETPPITLETLDKIVDPSNFEETRHKMSDSTDYVNHRGEKVSGRTYLRTPLNREVFNRLGKDPLANKEELDRLVTSRLSHVDQTSANVKINENTQSNRETPVRNSEVPVEETVSQTSVLTKELTEISGKLKDPSTTSEEKKQLLKRKIEITKQLNSRAYDANASRPVVGKERISIDKAKKLFKRLIPSASQEDLVFLSKLVLDKYAKPNENLLGLYQNGRIGILTDNNEVSERVLRHEIFHKIFHEYLTESERRSLIDALGGSEGRSIIEVEEELADMFMVFKDGEGGWLSNFFKRLFNKIKKWFGLIDQHEYTINSVFQNIVEGRYGKQLDPNPEARRAYSDVGDFGNVANYKEALGLVRGVVYRDVIKGDDLSIPPLTLQEAYDHTASVLQDQLKANKLDILDNQETINLLDPTEDAELIKDLNDLNDTLLETNVILEKLFPSKEFSSKVSMKVFRELWKDLYPSYEFVSKTPAFDSDKKTADFINIDEMTADEIEMAQLSGLKDFIMQSDTVNQESKMTEKVKNFLSFIYNDKKGNTPVNNRLAYFAAMRGIKELLPSEAPLEEQIRYEAERYGVDLDSSSNVAAVLRSVLNLLHEATTEVMTTKIPGEKAPVLLELNKKYNFLDENTYVDSMGQTLNRVAGQSTSSFLDTVIARENRIAEESETEVSPEVLKRTVNASFRQIVSRETARELFALFLSQTEANYMIGERDSYWDEEFGGYVNKRMYKSAQNFGAERATTAEIVDIITDNWGKIKVQDWKKFDAEKDPKKKLNIFLKQVLNLRGIGDINTFKAADTVASIEAFRTVVTEATKNGVKTISDPETGEDIAMDAGYLIQEEPRLLNLLTYAITSDSLASRPTTLKDTQGKTRFGFFNGSQAREVISRMIKFVRNDGYANVFPGKDLKQKRINSLPVHLRNKWGSKNIFVNGVNGIYEIKDHDGIRSKGRNEFGIGYSDEGDVHFLERNFYFGFLDYMGANTSSIEKPKYVQYFYTISNRPRMAGAEIDVLSDSGIEKAIENIVDQTLEQPNITNVANYDPSKMVNASLVKASIEQVIGKPFTREEWNTYRKTGFTPSQKNRIVQLTKAKLRVKAEEFMNKMEMEGLADQILHGKGVNLLKSRKYMPKAAYNENEAMYLDEEGNEIPMVDRESFFNRDDFKAAYSFVANNYVNSYFLNQLPVGNYNFFKHAGDLVKRMSGVFAPGAKGLVMDNNAFMAPQFRLAVMSDPKLLKEEIESVFSDTKLKEWAEDKTDLADAQGFMTPDRARQIELGFGKAYKVGAVVKPAFYGQTTITDEDGNEVQVPVMVKYSSVVLTDELVARFPKLKALREAMENQRVDELVFDSANKVGVPVAKDGNTNLRSMPGPNEGEFNISIPDGAVYNLNNENFRLQLNPAAESYGNISFMTQLAYFINTGHKLHPDKETQAKNEKAASLIYESFGRLVELGIEKMNRSISNGKIKKQAILNTLTGDESIAIATILKNGGSYNLPQIVDKALIQLMNTFAKNTIQPKFKGGHFTLQSAYGVEILGESNENYTEEHKDGLNPAGKRISKNLNEKARGLKYKYIPEKGFVAEVLVSKEFASKVRAGDFLLPDAMGFRIPSTGLHSSVALQVVGYYDSKDSNVIIAPPELVIQHGSDFDVDSLYVLGREVIQGDTYKDLGFPNGSIPGYFWNSEKKGWEFIKGNFESQLASIPDTDKRKSEIEAMFRRNAIAHGFISVISDINNKQTISEPISPQSIKEAFKELGGLKANDNVDLSNVLDNMTVFNSNFQGAKLVGIFANGTKALAYMMKAGENGSYPSVPALEKEGNEDSGLKLFGTTYDKFQETAGNFTIWQVLDALINTSVDNVKDQNLYLMNATDATGKYYIGGLSLGVPLADLIETMLQPVALEVTHNKGKINLLPAMLLARYNEVSSSPIGSKEDLYLKAEGREVSKEAAKKVRNKRLQDITNEQEILDQVAMYRQLDRLHRVSEDISKFSSAIGVLQNMPVTYTDIIKMDERWASMFELGPEGNILFDEEGNAQTKSSFSFNLDGLFKTQPNIKSAYDAYLMARNTAFNSFVKHHPVLNALSEKLSKDNVIQITFKNSEADLKNELFSYILSSMYSEELSSQETVNYKDRTGKERALVGKFAWSHDFAKRLEQVKNMYPENLFLKSISVSKNRGVYGINFNQTAGKDVMETFEMQEGFNTLPDEVANIFEPGELREGLVKYAVLNFGMRFGVTNYSSYLDAASLSRLDDYINKNVKEFLDTIDVNTIDAFTERSPLIDNFLDQVVTNHPEALPTFRKRDNQPEQKGTGPKGEKLFSGYENGIWFDRKFLVTDDNTKIPLYTKETRNGSSRPFKLIRTLDTPTGKVAYYQQLGFKNYTGGYNAIPLQKMSEPKIELFDGSKLHIATNRMSDTIHQVYDYPVNLLKKGDSVWVYPTSDPTRQSGVPAKVVSSTLNPGQRVHTVRVEYLSETETELTRAEYKAGPLIAEMQSRFKVPVKAVLAKDMPAGAENSKGAIKNGVIYLNFSLIKTDADLSETAFHEIAHPIIAEIAKRNPVWYKNLKEELKNNSQGQVILEAIKERYPELSPEEQIQEAIVSLVGRYSAENRAMGSKLKGYIKRVKEAIGKFVRQFLEDVLKRKDIRAIEDLADENLADVSLNDLSVLISSAGHEFKLDLSNQINEDWNTQRINEIEEKLIKEGRITFTCKL